MEYEIEKQETIECPECKCREILMEYDDNMLSWGHRNVAEGSPIEISWCYCLRCGMVFEPEQEIFYF